MKLEDNKKTANIHSSLSDGLEKNQQYIFILHCTTFEADISITCRPQYIRQHTEFCINDFQIVLTTHDIA